MNSKSNLSFIASMRPRHKAAENGAMNSKSNLSFIASMRPRHKAAENGTGGCPITTRTRCFNEAAA